jgi:hypothetical protein
VFLFSPEKSYDQNQKGEALQFMKSTKQPFLALLTLAALAAGAWAQSSGTTAAQPNKTDQAMAAPAQPTVTAADVQSLKDALAAQQEQIQQLSQQLQQAQAAASYAANRAAAAENQVSLEQQNVDSLRSDVADLKTVSDNGVSRPVLRNAVFSLQDAMQSSAAGEPQIFNKQMESSITLRLKGINITPGGYAAAEFVRRSHALGADLPTPFNSVTMPGASQSQLSEFFGSGRQSKATVFVDGHLPHVDLSSYISTDFLSAGVTSTSTSTNSYTLRLRQAWFQAKFDNGWSFLGGQAFSLVTENGKGIVIDDDMGKTGDVRPRTVDPSYNVGFNYARQWGLRLTKSYDKVAFAVSVENPQGTVTTHGNANNYLFNQAGASNSYNTTATYSFNPSPDLIAKVAFDPGFGHYEIFGIYSRFTDRIFPCGDIATSTSVCDGITGVSAAGAHNASKNGGGVGASARWKFANRVTFGVKGTGGSGIGRYAPGGLADASINPDGTVHLIKNLQGLGTLEFKASKRLDFYSYGGVEYAGRSWAIDTTPAAGPVLVGYGAPGFKNSGCFTEPLPGAGPLAGGLGSSCTADTRALIEGTFGFWYRFYSGPLGRFQYGTQVSYLTRNTWSGSGRQPNGIDTMVFSSFRYYLP